jgi:hypothetical protein
MGVCTGAEAKPHPWDPLPAPLMMTTFRFGNKTMSPMLRRMGMFSIAHPGAASVTVMRPHVKVEDPIPDRISGLDSNEGRTTCLGNFSALQSMKKAFPKKKIIFQKVCNFL